MKTTDSQTEQLIQVDAHNTIIGPISRSVAHQSNIYYRTLFVLIINSQGEVLIQKRSRTKDLYPDCWDLSVGGHVMYGDSYEDSAVREIAEELGLHIDANELTYTGEVLVTLPQSHEYFHVFEYLLQEDDQIHPASAEVADTKWMTIDEIKKSMDQKTLKWYPRPEQTIRALY